MGSGTRVGMYATRYRESGKGAAGVCVRRGAMENDVEHVLAELIAQQATKVRDVAARIDPRLTADDLLQPHDFPALARDPGFNYEDGVLAGLRAAEAALRAAHRR